MNNIIFKTTFLKGEDGNNILRIDKTATSGLVDTYTITLTDGTTTTFNVTNGSSIATIEKTATVGMVDTYTITLTDGSTSTFEVTNGANVTIDDQLDANSTNPVQNKVIYSALNNIDSANVKYGQNSNVDAELDKLQQTPITTPEGETLSTVDDKLNYLINRDVLVNGEGMGYISTATSKTISILETKEYILFVTIFWNNFPTRKQTLTYNIKNGQLTLIEQDANTTPLSVSLANNVITIRNNETSYPACYALVSV